MKCKACGKEINENFKFCNYCGKPIVKEVICHNCGQSMPEQSMFCGNCGAALQEEKVCPAQTNDRKKKVENNQRLYGYEYVNCNMKMRYVGWVNEFNGYVYFFYDHKLWKMSEEKKDKSVIYEGDGRSLNINKNGIFFFDRSGNGELVHIDFEGNIKGQFKLKKYNGFCSFFLYDDTIYYTSDRNDSNIIYVYSCKMDGSGYKELFRLPYENEDIGAGEVTTISSDGKIVVLNLYADVNRWYKIDLKSMKTSEIAFNYYSKITEENESLSIYHVDVMKRVAYTSYTFEEEKYYKLPWNKTVFQRSIDHQEDFNKIGKLVCKGVGGSCKDFAGFYCDYCWFNNNEWIGIAYSHRGKFAGCEDYYYNVYKTTKDGIPVFLNAGSRGGIEEFTITDKYIYFDKEYLLRVKLDGTGFERF